MKASEIKKSDRKTGYSRVIPQKWGGMLINYLKCGRDVIGDQHYHPDGWELIMLIRGKMEFEGIVLDKPGDMICFTSNEIHNGKFFKGTIMVVFKNACVKKVPEPIIAINLDNNASTYAGN